MDINVGKILKKIELGEDPTTWEIVALRAAYNDLASHLRELEHAALKAYEDMTRLGGADCDTTKVLASALKKGKGNG